MQYTFAIFSDFLFMSLKQTLLIFFFFSKKFKTLFSFHTIKYMSLYISYNDT